MDIKDLNKEQRLEVFFSVLNDDQLNKDTVRKLLNNYNKTELAVVDKTERYEIIFENDLTDIYEISGSNCRTMLKDFFPNIITNRKPLEENKWYLSDIGDLVKIKKTVADIYLTDIMSTGNYYTDTVHTKATTFLSVRREKILEYIESLLVRKFGSGWDEVDIITLDTNNSLGIGYHDDTDTYVTKKGVIYQNGKFATKKELLDHQWYKFENGFVYHIKDNYMHPGIIDGEWVTTISKDFINTQTTLAHDDIQTLKQHLLEIADKKGYKAGARFASVLDGQTVYAIRNGVFLCENSIEEMGFSLIDNNSRVGNYIFHKGKWAEIKRTDDESIGWYTLKNNPEKINIFIKDFNDTSNNFGFLRAGTWFENFDSGWSYSRIPEEWKPASLDKVRESLITEAYKRGYTKESLEGRYGFENYSDNTDEWYFTGGMLFTAPPGGGGYRIFDNGKWLDIQ